MAVKDQAITEVVTEGEQSVLCGLARLINDERLQLSGLLVDTQNRLVRVLSEELEEACGIPLTWFDVLVRLGAAEAGWLTMTQLASEISLTSGGVTRLVDRIAEAGLVERLQCPSDRRSVHVSLTDAGRDKLAEAAAVHLAGLDANLMSPLSETERADLGAILEKLRRALTPDA
jgi:MarR family 2-MHQ and catechol resistance regulon transcriptional repressor